MKQPTNICYQEAKYDKDYDSDIIISDTSGLVKKTDYNAETTETEGKNNQYQWFSYYFCINCS